MRRLPVGIKTVLVAAIITVAAGVPVPAHAYGPIGHLIASIAAKPLVCERGLEKIAELTPGEPFEELGLWADRIRADDAWAHAAPWHYMNVPDGSNIDTHATPAEGDVLWAIEHFSSELADPALDAGRRAEALKFLIHFVVDVHQPLHVGRESDRGGNRTSVRYPGVTVNLHAFWDTNAITLTGLGADAYAASIADDVARAFAHARGSDPRDWAQESLELRAEVYDFGPGGRLDPAYLENAKRLTRERLVLASARLAATLNAVLCD